VDPSLQSSRLLVQAYTVWQGAVREGGGTAMATDSGHDTYTRRDVLEQAARLAGAVALPGTVARGVMPAVAHGSRAELRHRVSRVALVRTDNRATGTRRAIDLLRPVGLAQRTVLLKPNYNTAGPAPAATDTGLLEALVQELRVARAGPITIGDRSGMATTREAMAAKGVFALAKRYGLEVVAFDEMGAQGWRYFAATGTHWQQGFAVARPVLEAGAVVSTCCLKTHRFGGYFSLSLKNSVGMVAKYVPGDAHNYMAELHASPYQRLMIAEMNRVYAPALIVLDGVTAFVDGGPDLGTVARPGVILAGTDRVAVDAVGVALLRLLGTTPAVAAGSIWQLEQIRRAVELGLGVGSAAQIELLTGDRASQRMADHIRRLL
jgi:uncharacterized protein (DUF362 family)